MTFSLRHLNGSSALISLPSVSHSHECTEHTCAIHAWTEHACTKSACNHFYVRTRARYGTLRNVLEAGRCTPRNERKIESERERILCLNGRRKEDNDCRNAGAQWGRTAKNWDVSTGPIARPFARSPAPLTHSLASHRLLRLRTPLCSLLYSLAPSITPKLVGK